MTKIEFQATHGPAWAELSRHPAFFAALQLENSDSLRRILALTDTEIRENGHIILAEFKGRLQTGNFLINLAVEAEEQAFDLPPETYDDSQDRAAPPAEPEGGTSFIPASASPVRKKKPTRKK